MRVRKGEEMKIIFDVYGSVVLSVVGIMLAFAMMITVADTLKSSLDKQLVIMEEREDDLLGISLE